MSGRSRVKAVAEMGMPEDTSSRQRYSMHLRANLIKITILAMAASAALCARTAHADDWLGADQGKLLLTAGFTDADGAGGGGLVPPSCCRISNCTRTAWRWAPSTASNFHTPSNSST
jgi:hypothetical protein